MRPARPNTVKRAKDEARLVITLEVKVDMSDTPSWQTDAIDRLRAIGVEEMDPTDDGFDAYLKDAGVQIQSHKIEVAK